MTGSWYDPWHSARIAAEVGSATRGSADALQALRAQRLAKLLTAARGSRIYAEVLKGRDPARVALQTMPVMHRAELMQRFDDWVTDPQLRLDELQRFTADPRRIGEPYLGRYLAWESSGSSGEPGVFVQDATAMAVCDALEAQRRPSLRPWQRLFDPWLLGERSVFIGATGGHFASTVSMARLRRLNPVLAVRLHSVSFLQPVRQLADELQRLAPTIVMTYPSVAMMLAEEHAAGRLDIAPRELWTGGEMLSPALRRVLADEFGCPVANSYGASEFLALASECRHGRMHLNSDWAILEPVDEAGGPVPCGQVPATTLLTNLANHVQPLIRYDLGDRVTLHAQRCACGSWLPTIDVQGRSDDALRLGRGPRTALLSALAISTVLEDEAGLFDFQLVQHGPGEVLLRTGLHGADGQAALARAHDALAGFLVRQGAVGVKIRCKADAPARPNASGKILRVVATPV